MNTAKLPRGSFRYDNDPDGHVSVFASPAEIREAVVDIPGLTLKRLEDGSYRLPK